jgi:hypothetical protein
LGTVANAIYACGYSKPGHIITVLLCSSDWNGICAVEHPKTLEQVASMIEHGYSEFTEGDTNQQGITYHLSEDSLKAASAENYEDKCGWIIL